MKFHTLGSSKKFALTLTAVCGLQLLALPSAFAACTVPAEGKAENTKTPTRVIGNGTSASCTSQAVVAAIAKGGIITFNCGPDAKTIVMKQTAKIFNNTGPKIVIDGGNKITLSGENKRRILYMNTCDPNQVWTTPNCDNQDHPQLTLQNITFRNGNSKSETTYDGGGAVWARGGRLKLVNAKFYNNVCADTGASVGGGAVAVYDQFQKKPVYITNSRFGANANSGNTCSNAGAINSVGVAFVVNNSQFISNKAIGRGANPAKPGTPGGGNAGAIFTDGNGIGLNICNTKFQNNIANEGGGAIFFVSSDGQGSLKIKDSTLTGNKSLGFETSGYPGIFYRGREATPIVENSTITP